MESGFIAVNERIYVSASEGRELKTKILKCIVKYLKRNTVKSEGARSLLCFRKNSEREWKITLAFKIENPK